MPPYALAPLLAPLHGIASRHDLPLPFPFVVVGAGVALVVSFVVLGLAWKRPRYATVGGVGLPRLTRFVDGRGTRTVARVVVLALFLVVAAALFAGRDLLTNPVFGFVFVWMWVGLVPLSLLLGPFWRVVSPLRTLHRLLCAVARTDPREGLLEIPRGFGQWPGAIHLAAFTWLELVQPDRTTLPVLRVWALAWLVVVVLGAIVFGERWFAASDPFEVYSTTVARLSPWHRSGDTLRLVNPLAGLTAWRPGVGTVGVVSVLLGSTAFDSFTNTSWWLRTVQSSAVPAVLWATAGLLVMIAIVLVTFSLAAAWMARYGTAGPRTYARAMAGSLVPIVVGYAVAHYFTLLVIEGQRVAVNLSDPLGRGWDLLGTGGWRVDSSIADHPTAVALVQLIAIVAGHVLGAVAAHEKAVSLLPPEKALRGQWPMLVLMVGYTSAGLVLLFSP
ncbi:hypothetical protein [Microlunatus flavus]|uniref:Uncharacterized protein n=1 Tax=Microlunatus flavus TaxID=1036181 RepID=A0A1H9I899_9ACTN|nr:hypothetical protein [Microlunatus flavus]SEQ70941.1 hypothetical protein SAMN05421756_105133 [Microlunatus flavus]